MGLKAYSGVGCVFMANVDAHGVRTGPLREVGNAYPLSVQVTTEQIEQLSRKCDTAGQTLAVKTEITGTNGTLTLREWNAANLAWALAGDAVEQSDTGGNVPAENVTAPEAGAWVEFAHRDVSNVVIMDETDTTTYVEGTDYRLNTRLGMLSIIEGGGIIAADVLHAAYDYEGKDGYIVEIGTNALVRVALLAELRNEFTGEEFVLELDSVVLAANAEINFISEAGTEGEELPFDITLETVGTNTSPGRVDGIQM